MKLRPVTRRGDPIDVETASKLVARAERLALERAEQLREEAEQLVKSIARQTVDAETKVSEEFAADLRALRDELDAAGRRATVAESELDLLRSAHADLEARARAAGVAVELTPPGESLPPLQMVTTEAAIARGLSGPRLTAAARTAATRLHAQAELELTRAREEAARLVAAATAEAEELLTNVLAAIDRDRAAADATRTKAERDIAEAADLRNELEARLAGVKEEAARIREEAARIREEADRAREEAASFREQSRLEAARLMDDARGEARYVVEQARIEARELILAARRDGAAPLKAARDQLRSEVLAVRNAVARARDDLTSQTATPPASGCNLTGLAEAGDG